MSRNLLSLNYEMRYFHENFDTIDEIFRNNTVTDTTLN